MIIHNALLRQDQSQTCNIQHKAILSDALAGLRKGLVHMGGGSDQSHDGHDAGHGHSAQHRHHAGTLQRIDLLLVGHGDALHHRGLRGHGEGGRGSHARSHCGLSGDGVMRLGLGLRLGFGLNIARSSLGKGQKAEDKQQKEGGVFHWRRNFPR
jgi:hypothetical protein